MKIASMAAALALLSLPAAAQQNPAWTQATAPFRLIGDTYYVGSAGLTAYLIKTSRGLILLDVGLPKNAVLVEKNIQALGFGLKDVKILINSHGHYDHAGGLARLKADTGATLVSSEGERYALEKGVYAGSEQVKSFDFPPVTVDRLVQDGEGVTLGDVTVTAHLTPGHTKGCTSWSWPVKDEDGSAHTALDFCSASVAANSLVPEQYPGIVDDYRRTFALAKTLPGDVFLSAHTDFFGFDGKRARLGRAGPNPFIDRAGYERLIDEQHAAFLKSLAEQQAKKGG